MSIKSITDELTSLGFPRKAFRTLKEAQAALAAAKAGKPIKPSFSKPVMVAKLAPAAKAPAISAIDSLKLAAKSARTASAKVEAYSQLVAKLNADLHAEKDLSKQALIQRDLISAQRSEAYARLASRAENPGAEKIQRYLDAADS